MDPLHYFYANLFNSLAILLIFLAALFLEIVFLLAAWSIFLVAKLNNLVASSLSFFSTAASNFFMKVLIADFLDLYLAF